MPSPFTQKRKQMDKKRWGEFSAELEKEEVSSIIDPDNFDESYQEWSNQVLKIRDKYCSKKKHKKQGKCNRLLLAKRKRQLCKELKSPGVDKETVRMLKKRKELVMEYMDKERMMENKR